MTSLRYGCGSKLSRLQPDGRLLVSFGLRGKKHETESLRKKHQIGETPSPHFSHCLASMNFDSHHADAHGGGNLLVCQT